MRAWFASFRYFDLILFGSSTLLLLLGMLMIYSTTLEGSSNLLIKQAVAAVAGYIIMFCVAFFDYRNLKKTTSFLYVGIILALLYVWFFATPIRGSARWID